MISKGVKLDSSKKYVCSRCGLKAIKKMIDLC